MCFSLVPKLDEALFDTLSSLLLGQRQVLLIHETNQKRTRDSLLVAHEWMDVLSMRSAEEAGRFVCGKGVVVVWSKTRNVPEACVTLE